MRATTVSALTRTEEREILAEFIDLETGLIRELLQPGVGFEDPDWFLGIALPARIWNTGLFAGRHNLSEGNAVGESEQAAVLGAIGETLERYCLAFFDRRRLVMSSFDDAESLGLGRCTDPDDYALFAPDQRPNWCVPFTRQSVVAWTEGVSLVDKRSRWVPAQLVYLPYAPGADEDYVFSATSSGTAFGANLESAVLSGLCETVERDAFALYWLNRPMLPSLDVLADPILRPWYRRLFGKYDNQINVFDLTTEIGIPCFYAVLKGRAQQTEPFISVGASCHPDPERALKKAILEAFHTRRYGMNLMMLEGMADGGYLAAGSSSETNKFHAHVLRYTRPVPLEQVDFCYQPRETVSVTEALAGHRRAYADEGGTVRTCVGRLRAAGYDPIAVDVTTDEVAEKGFFAIKTLVPGLHPLWAGEDVPLGGKRLYEVPARLGWGRKPRDQMNLFPHPFP
jgi:ribosomal protein S12 methylthiotransferase accessory factor